MISLLLVGICLLRRNLKWARRINPIILTLAFVFDLPLYHVNQTYYFVLNVSANTGMFFLIPWMACETFAGQIISCQLCYASIMIAIHNHFDVSWVPLKFVPYWVICSIVATFLMLDIQNSLKRQISQKFTMRRQRNEFE